MNHVRVGVIGCGHGYFDEIFKECSMQSPPLDLLIICGDVQCVRNKQDLQSISVPEKFKKLGSFHKYYSGELKVPCLTVIIGGNHESSHYMMEFPYGGWVCENIYYLGYAGVVNFKGLRIAGLSGIYKNYSYKYNHYESIPLDEHNKRSVYHVRQCDVQRLSLLSPGSIDIFISHDWPKSIEMYGDYDSLFKVKPDFKQESHNGSLGSPPSLMLLSTLRPRNWFAAHMHVYFTATVNFEDSTSTNFVALDKIVDRASTFFQVFDIESNAEVSGSDGLYYDVEWLAILKATNQSYHWATRKSFLSLYKEKNEIDFSAELLWIKEYFTDLKIPNYFRQSVPLTNHRQQNQQTRDFCEKLLIKMPSDDRIVNRDEIKLQI